jgi:hypothetical protein
MVDVAADDSVLASFRTQRRKSLLGNEDLESEPNAEARSKKFDQDDRRYDRDLLKELDRWWNAGHTHIHRSKRAADELYLDFEEYKYFYQRLVYAFNVRTAR